VCVCMFMFMCACVCVWVKGEDAFLELVQDYRKEEIGETQGRRVVGKGVGALCEQVQQRGQLQVLNICALFVCYRNSRFDGCACGNGGTQNLRKSET